MLAVGGKNWSKSLKVRRVEVIRDHAACDLER